MANKQAPIVRVLIDGEIELDVSITERHTAAVELTRHPVEEGANPVDHARVLPERLQIDGLVTNAPLLREESRSSPPGETGYAQRMHAKLLELKNSRRAVTVKTALRSYQNMVLVQLDTPTDSKTGDAVRLTLAFEEVRFVRSERVRLEQVTAPTGLPQKPTKKTDQGKKPPEATKPEQRKTVAKTIGDALGWTTPGAGIAP